jgi:hypothetical protein
MKYLSMVHKFLQLFLPQKNSTPALQETDHNLERPLLRPIYPVSTYVQDDRIDFVALPATSGLYEFEIRCLNQKDRIVQKVSKNHLILKNGLGEGQKVVRVRYKNEGSEFWSPWSLPEKFSVLPLASQNKVEQRQQAEHRLSLSLEKTHTGLNTIISTQIQPENFSQGDTWYPSPCIEGYTPLLNEEASYYKDPRAYFEKQIDRLIEKKARFVSWENWSDCRHNPDDLNIILQFDIDGGIHSMKEAYAALQAKGVTANIMTHWQSLGWYEYCISPEHIQWLKQAEANGWCIGYHNNSMTNTLSENPSCSDKKTLKVKAQNRFLEDVEMLREFFDLRYFTNHGGNADNNIGIHPSSSIASVDKPSSPELWSNIRSSFSDGGFISRPTSLESYVVSLIKGTHFLRIHPFKYYNFENERDLGRDWRSSELGELEMKWLDQRRKKNQRPLNYASHRKPISSQLEPYDVIRSKAEEMRKHRGPHFKKLYPCTEGDSRTFWWRLMHHFGPQQGKVLIVGALPPEQKKENHVFFSPGVQVEEIDIDASRKPDHVGDILDFNPESQYDAVFLMGLPYFASPSQAVEKVMTLLKKDGIAVLGFAASTNRFRGGLWHPKTRPVWKKELEPLQDIGLQGQLWSFDESQLSELLKPFAQCDVECFSHYWYVTGRRPQ